MRSNTPALRFGSNKWRKRSCGRGYSSTGLKRLGMYVCRTSPFTASLSGQIPVCNARRASSSANRGSNPQPGGQTANARNSLGPLSGIARRDAHKKVLIPIPSQLTLFSSPNQKNHRPLQNTPSGSTYAREHFHAESANLFPSTPL